MNALNPQQTAEGSIDLELNHPIYGWIPFTASPHDPHGVELYVQAVNGLFGPVAEYIPPEQPEIILEQSTE